MYVATVPWLNAAPLLLSELFLPSSLVNINIAGSLREQKVDVACSTSHHQGPHIESCLSKAVTSDSSRNLAKFNPLIADPNCIRFFIC